MTYISLQLIKTELLGNQRRLTLAYKTNSQKRNIDFSIEAVSQLLPLYIQFSNAKVNETIEIIVDNFYKLNSAIYIINMFSNNIKSNTIIS